MRGLIRIGMGGLVAIALGGCSTPPILQWRGAQDDAVSRTSLQETAATPTPLSPPAPPALPIDAFVRRALAENREARAARLNVESLRYRIPQVTSLDDPVLSNTIFPVPSVAPQYSLMGYMPYDALIAQQFPWFGTLRLRGVAAEQDVAVALYELAAVQLDVAAAVKSACHDLAFAQRADTILAENRGLAVAFIEVARERYKTGSATQTDVLRAEGAVSDIDRERAINRQNLGTARAELARLTHDAPEAPLIVAAEGPASPALPVEIERLYQLAVAARPELQGRLAAVARDGTAVELARLKSRPNVSVGLVYQQMERRNAVTPQTAGGMPNVGLFVGFNLPVYHKRNAAAVLEAQARAAADSALYESERDQALRDVKDAYGRVNAQGEVLTLLRDDNLPRARQIFESATADYRSGNAGADYLGLISAWRDVLQVELQTAQVEAELGKAIAALERAVGAELNANPPPPAAVAPPTAELPHIPIEKPETVDPNPEGARNG